jgi:hypothetical protein
MNLIVLISILAIISSLLLLVVWLHPVHHGAVISLPLGLTIGISAGWGGFPIIHFLLATLTTILSVIGFIFIVIVVVVVVAETASCKETLQWFTTRNFPFE